MTLLALGKATTVLLAALVGLRLARRARASVRHLILASSFAVLAALPLGTAVLPALELQVRPRSAPLARPTAAGSVQAITEGGRRVPAPSRSGAALGEVEGPAPASGLPGVRVALTIWLMGAGIAFVSLGRGLYRMQRLRHSALPCQTTRRLAPALARTVGVSRAVDVSVHEALNTPITCGIARPAILLPPDAPQWPRAALTRALIHELEPRQAARLGGADLRTRRLRPLLVPPLSMDGVPPAAPAG